MHIGLVQLQGIRCAEAGSAAAKRRAQHSNCSYNISDEYQAKSLQGGWRKRRGLAGGAWLRLRFTWFDGFLWLVCYLVATSTMSTTTKLQIPRQNAAPFDRKRRSTKGRAKG